jgi:hypothetical protein
MGRDDAAGARGTIGGEQFEVIGKIHGAAYCVPGTTDQPPYKHSGQPVQAPRAGHNRVSPASRGSPLPPDMAGLAPVSGRCTRIPHHCGRCVSDPHTSKRAQFCSRRSGRSAGSQ